MTEVSFARTFLQTLDSKPTKISADHVEDPRSYPSRPPSILPKQPRPFNPPSTTSSSSQPSASQSAPGSEPSLTVSLKSLRNPPLDLRFTSQPPTTSILDLKNAVSAKTGLPVDKIKLLLHKKPVNDTKVLKELVEAGKREVEFGVMVLGGAAALAAASAGASPTTAAAGSPTAGGAGVGAEDKHVAVGPSGAEVLKTEEFWTDLGGYLQQRIRDERAAGELLGAFRGSYEALQKR